MVFTVPTLQDLPYAAQRILAAAGNKRVILFYGDMGAGKTTLVKALCEHLGVEEATSSPTFSIVNEYGSANGPVYHFDFYRLKSEQEAFDLGYEDYFYSGSYCLVEWPEKISGLLPDDAVSVWIDVMPDGGRRVKLTT